VVGVIGTMHGSPYNALIPHRGMTHNVSSVWLTNPDYDTSGPGGIRQGPTN
jgi:hypothetical protein